MLQLTKFYEQCYKDFYQSHPELMIETKSDLKKVKERSKNLFAEIDQLRFHKSQKNFLYYLDHITWTNAREHIDDPEFAIKLKHEIIQGLHLKNVLFNTYKKTIDILRPLISEINQKENRPARLLELGSGVGKLTMAIYEEFKKSTLQIELTGSDIVPEYVQAATAESSEKNYAIDFKVIDAYQLDQLEESTYDIIFTLHSMHHFKPEELAVIMAGAQNVATRAFIGVDGYRGLGNLFFMMMSGGGKSLLSFNSAFFHDSFISGRKMYSAKQLEIIAKLACPHSTIIARNMRPGLSSIQIYF